MCGRVQPNGWRLRLVRARPSSPRFTAYLRLHKFSTPSGERVDDVLRCRKSSEPLSGTSRTGLRRTKTEIGKWQAETAAVKPAAGEPEFEDCRPETSAWKPNLREMPELLIDREAEIEPPHGGIKIRNLTFELNNLGCLEARFVRI